VFNKVEAGQSRNTLPAKVLVAGKPTTKESAGKPAKVLVAGKPTTKESAGKPAKVLVAGKYALTGQGGEEMKRIVKDVMLALLVLGALIFALPNYIQAEETSDLAQELIDEDVSQDVINELANTPGDTMGQRLDDMLKNGSVTQRQYDKIYNNFVNLPDEKRWAIKGAYDKGYGDKVYDRLTDAAHSQLDDASLRDHIKDLKQQGLTREEIHKRLNEEGVSVGHLKDLGYGPEGSRSEHLKDIRNMDTAESQHKVDRAHEKKQDRKELKERKDHAKDMGGRHERAKEKKSYIKDRPRLKEGAHNKVGGGEGSRRGK
jgi:hypothetical protein